MIKVKINGIMNIESVTQHWFAVKWVRSERFDSSQTDDHTVWYRPPRTKTAVCGPSTCLCAQRTKIDAQIVHLMDRFGQWTKIIILRLTDSHDGPLKIWNFGRSWTDGRKPVHGGLVWYSILYTVWTILMVWLPDQKGLILETVDQVGILRMWEPVTTRSKSGLLVSYRKVCFRGSI